MSAVFFNFVKKLIGTQIIQILPINTDVLNYKSVSICTISVIRVSIHFV